MFSECSRRIRKFPKTFLQPNSPACHGGAATSSRLRGTGWGWDDALRPAILCHTNFEASQRGREPNTNGKRAKRRRITCEKTSGRHCERRRAAVRSASPYPPVYDASIGNRGSPDPVAREGVRNIRTRVSLTQSRKRARADHSEWEDEEIVDGAGAGSSSSGACSISPRITRTPAPPRVHIPHFDLSGTQHENYVRVSSYGADELGSDDARAGASKRSLPPVFDDLVSGVRILWDLSCQFWGLRYSTNARDQQVPTWEDSAHVQNIPSHFLEGLEVPCASRFHDDSLFGEPERPDDDEHEEGEDEEMEVEDALFSLSDDETLCGSWEGSLDLESDKYQGPGSLSGQSRPNFADKSFGLATSLISPPVHRAIFVCDAPKTGSPREYGQSQTRAGAQGLGLDGDLPISSEIPDDETLLSRYSFPHWRYYRFEGVREEHANGSTRAERKVPVRYCDEANIEAQGAGCERARRRVGKRRAI